MDFHVSSRSRGFAAVKLGLRASDVCVKAPVGARAPAPRRPLRGMPGKKLSIAACSDVGLRRQANEDSFAMSPELGLYVVADGMGGHRAGKVASEMATEHAIQAIDALKGVSESPAEKLRQAVACANREVHDMAQRDPDLAGMGTTFVSFTR